MRKIFLDVGAANGNSIKFFRENHKESDQFEIYSFEPFPKNIEELEQFKPKVTVIPAAVWSFDGEIPMYTGKPKSGSMYADKITGKVSLENKIMVPCIDLAKFIMENFKKEDEIWIKMNIEGSEYEVVPHLHKHGLIDWFDSIYIRWHATKIPSLVAVHDEIAKLVPDSVNLWRKKGMFPLEKS